MKNQRMGQTPIGGALSANRLLNRIPRRLRPELLQLYQETRRDLKLRKIVINYHKALDQVKKNEN